jgi:hypothetical protein
MDQRMANTEQTTSKQQAKTGQKAPKREETSHSRFFASCYHQTHAASFPGFSPDFRSPAARSFLSFLAFRHVLAEPVRSLGAFA